MIPWLLITLLKTWFYILIGIGCAIRADDESGPTLGRVCAFVVIATFWPVALGSLIAKGVIK